MCENRLRARPRKRSSTADVRLRLTLPGVPAARGPGPRGARCPCAAGAAHSEGISAGTMLSTRSPCATSSLSSTAMFSTLPLMGADTTVSIFMAERTSAGAPASTRSPGFTLRSTTRPPMGAPTCPGLSGSALGRMVAAAVDERSATTTERGVPLSSKKTSRVPALGSSSPMARSFTERSLPSSISNSICSPFSMGSTKARVGSLVSGPNLPISFL
mmetsp:Transcript_8253/g.28051  ORF Transcript_8253/g.28051 Transcript_8253/m.28051 type:complete len:216 (-) Transcript_8253:3085-3732(-)